MKEKKGLWRNGQKMKKNEVNQLVNKIKGYYNSQFFVDDYVLDAWYETMQQYELEDALEHLTTYLKENPDYAPKPHTFTKGLLTREEKEMIKNSKYTVECNLCHRWMSIQQYEDHYGRCLDIQYLVSVAKQKGEEFDREDLENCTPQIIDKLLNKYPPKETTEFLGVKL